MHTNSLDPAHLAAQAAAWQHSTDPSAMLSSARQALAEGRISVLDPRRLRLPAVWAAMSVSERSWPAVETTKAFLRGEVDLHALTQAGGKARSGVAGASMIGLPRCIPHAAAQIAAYSTTFEPLDAAMEAVSWAVKAARWREVERIMETAPDAAPKDHFPRIREYLLAHPQLDAQCDTQVRPRYADACRLFLGNPFAGTPGAITYSDIGTLLEPLRDDPAEPATAAKPAPIPQAVLTRLWALVDKTMPS